MPQTDNTAVRRMPRLPSTSPPGFRRRRRQHGCAQDASASEHLAAGVQAATKTATGVSPCYPAELPIITDTTGNKSPPTALPRGRVRVGGFDGPPSLRDEVNVVEVTEINPPSGQEPVHWLLVTTRPVDTAQKLWKVVDHYRSRWTVEEYFKAMKTGCDDTSLQHRSANTLLCALAATAVVAQYLLVLRYLMRNAGELPAKAVVTDLQLQVLETTKPDVLSATPTPHEAMTAVANLGGHIKSNGEPGWQVLGRGHERLLEYEQAFALGMHAQAEK